MQHFHREVRMLEKYIKPILIVSGVVTMLPILQFFAPGFILQTSHLEITEPAGVFYAQHWGIMAFSVGFLLVYSARELKFHRSIMLAAGIEKLGLVGLALRDWNHPALAGLHAAVLFDSVCVLVYALYLLQKPSPR